MDGYHEYAGGAGIAVQVTRVDDDVTIAFYRCDELLVRIDTNRNGAIGMVQKILGAMQ